MAMTDANSVAQKWKRNLQQATQTIKDGVTAVTKSPMEAAAAQKAAYVAGVQRAADSGKWEAGLRSVSTQSWKDAMINKGVPRISSGVEGAVTKVQSFFAQLLPYTAQVSATIRAMPKGTIEDSVARAAAAIRMMSNFTYAKKTS